MNYSSPVPNPVGLTIASICILGIAWRFNPWSLLLVLPAITWVFAVAMTNEWWRARSRIFGVELETRCLRDLTRVASLLKIPIETNIPVPGAGDADAVLGTPGTIVEIKSFRSWDPGAARCIATTEQVVRLQQRLNLRKAIIWLPIGKLTTAQRIGIQGGLPPGTQLVVGPAWRPAIKCFWNRVKC